MLQSYYELKSNNEFDMLPIIPFQIFFNPKIRISIEMISNKGGR